MMMDEGRQQDVEMAVTGFCHAASMPGWHLQVLLLLPGATRVQLCSESACVYLKMLFINAMQRNLCASAHAWMYSGGVRSKRRLTCQADEHHEHCKFHLLHFVLGQRAEMFQSCLNKLARLAEVSADGGYR
jgi:hypothetical protein